MHNSALNNDVFISQAQQSDAGYELLSVDISEQKLDEINQTLEKMTAQERVEWGVKYLPNHQVLSSSFGIQSAVMLHLVTKVNATMPIIVVDTGYLFAETYQLIDQLTDKLSLNLHIYKSELSPAWQEARYGQLWQQGVEGLSEYNNRNKVEPMERAFQELNGQTWFSGLRRQQSSSRGTLPVLSLQKGRFKLLPIVDWSNKQVFDYLAQYDLPVHPLWEKGYVSVGDTHTSRPLQLGESEEDTRFFGLKRECGLHDEQSGSGI
ncbi:phosphoadenylyl-sulfate reductase [Vibrio sp. SS-MA-C1-2]|uniref:phosphoadenylyl-sulfate reductase n=1 Tax=Vibrio sp. SS-MA-C1-2 TaxID=2908646 RepID=UPI001F35A3CF|nr:phosphoadenylyl-sulfate reductase [Vibrio sp. SS-MA-C1-2]UJF18002.1 phosphoadenylyl-sulfate reductase [Vibrio sp. SS-MA-C1-2]